MAINLDGYTQKDAIHVAYIHKPVFTLSRDTSLCIGDKFVLHPAISNVSYLWQDGSTQPQFTVETPGTYSVSIANQCGSNTGNIIVNNGICRLFVPTGFTPNNDGVNDVFKVKYDGLLTGF